jgi:hypothetical protein
LLPASRRRRERISVAGDVWPDYIVQASTNLVTWNDLFTNNPPALPFDWLDSDALLFKQRFDRVLLAP